MSETYDSVWDALFDDPGEIATNKVKSSLMDEINSYINRNRLTQAKAAEKMGISQPRVSDICTGKISKFTIDAMVEILARVGVEVELKPKQEEIICAPRRFITLDNAQIAVMCSSLLENGGAVDEQYSVEKQRSWSVSRARKTYKVRRYGRRK